MKAIKLSAEEKKVINRSTVNSVKDAKSLKYSFREKKRDGSLSKAYEGYQKFQLGEAVEIHYSKEQKTNKNDKPCAARGIVFFGDKVSHKVVTTLTFIFLVIVLTKLSYLLLPFLFSFDAPLSSFFGLGGLPTLRSATNFKSDSLIRCAEA